MRHNENYSILKVAKITIPLLEEEKSLLIETIDLSSYLLTTVKVLSNGRTQICSNNYNSRKHAQNNDHLIKAKGKYFFCQQNS